MFATINEPASNDARATFLADHAAAAREVLARELKRREKKTAKADSEEDAGPLVEQDAEDSEDS